jgi:indole-3-glycerol phosphate synthase
MTRSISSAKCNSNASGGNFLDLVRDCKKREVATAKARRPESVLRTQVEAGAPDRRSFSEALQLPGISLIAECKQTSPSAGVIVANYQPGEIAAAYQAAGARAISVLTDSCHFHGRLQDVTEVRAQVQLPVLRKDFLLDPYQLYESAAAGADCILLIARFLEQSLLKDLYQLAGELGLEVLLETHDADEVKKAVAIGAKIIGINNRNLEKLVTDLDVTRQLRDLVPDEAILVSESGIRTRDDVLMLEKLGVPAILVGEHLLKTDNPGAAAARLLGA